MAGNVYIVSDAHLGAPDSASSRQRERLLVDWLDTIAPDAAEIILLGDLFDFWFEWRHVVPKGYVRLLGKLAELTDSGLKITAFAGNHDLWYRDYFKDELGIPVHHGPVSREWFGKRYYLAHGDGLGPGQRGYKFMKAVFTNRLAHWLFSRLIHPSFAVKLATASSKASRQAHAEFDDIDKGPQEYLYQYVRDRIADGDSHDYFVFGHRHLPNHMQMSASQELLVLGDWIRQFTYIEISADGPRLMRYVPDADPLPVFTAPRDPLEHFASLGAER